MGDLIMRSTAGGLSVNNGPSVLGEQQAKIPVGGKIRPGIKVLTATAAKHPNARGIYDAGVAAGHKWAAIEKALREQCDFDKSPLTPRNVPYFSVFREDFSNPAIADRIMEIYGEVLDRKRQLLRFPVIFPTDSWQANLPHALRSYTRSGLQYWSDYDHEGNRRCFTRKAPDKDGRNKRAVRTFGGRQSIPRPDTDGVCNPEKCNQYQTGACNLSGDLLFFIPGIPGGAAISLPLTSFYAMDMARQAMAMVAYLRGGRISGTHDGQPIFYITKKLTEVSMLDRETGEPKRVSHWIVTLEADIDMLQVFQAAEQRALTAGASGANAAQALSGPTVDLPADHDDDDHKGAIDGEVVAGPAPQDEPVDPHAALKAARLEVADLIKQVDVAPQVFSDWMARTTSNPDWGRDMACLAKAKEELATALEEGADEWKELNGLDTPF